MEGEVWITVASSRDGDLRWLVAAYLGVGTILLAVGILAREQYVALGAAFLILFIAVPAFGVWRGRVQVNERGVVRVRGWFRTAILNGPTRGVGLTAHYYNQLLVTRLTLTDSAGNVVEAPGIEWWSPFAAWSGLVGDGYVIPDRQRPTLIRIAHHLGCEVV